jgi:TonB-linked SusC/RagA family outer membrane protein
MNKINNTIKNTLAILFLAPMLLVGYIAGAQSVTGRVTDPSGEPVIGGNVIVKGTNTGVITDANGVYKINAAADATLTFSCIGYVAQEIKVDSRAVIDVTLAEEAEQLEDLVVVGYGAQKKVNLSGSVSSVSAKAMENRPVSNANFALQGLAPGINIQMSSGNPNSAPDINIRGYTSINGGSAFILVDNVPVTSAELARLNPADIENVSVLKDAAAAAIYGARAAFGVMLITTKTAKNEKLQIDVDMNYSIRSYINRPEFLSSSYEYMKMARELRRNPSLYTDDQLAYALAREKDPSLRAILPPEDALNPANRAAGYWEYYCNTDWYETLMNDTAPTQTYNIRIGQKGEKLNYSISGGYYRQDGMLKYMQDVYSRYNFRANGTYKITKWWDVGSNVSFSRSDYKRPTYTDDEADPTNSVNGFYRIIQSFPLKGLYNPDGSMPSGDGERMRSLVDGGEANDGINETQLSFNTVFNILKDVWQVKADATFRFTDQRHDAYEPRTEGAKDGPNLTPGVSYPNANTSSSLNRYQVYNLYTDFHKTFGDKHFVQALAGFNQEEYYSNYYSVSVDRLLTPSLPTIQLTDPNAVISKTQSIQTLALRGYFGRLGYTFDNRYIVELDGRYDLTSRYPKNHRGGFFPSASVAWTLSNEKFFAPVNDLLKISALKFRASYGSLGNQVNSSYYPYIATMGVTQNIGRLIDGERPLAITQPGVVSSDLTWETVRTVNFGIDLSLFNSRLDITFDKYTRYTEGMLTQSQELPAIFGASPPSTNAANLKTKGWDLSINWRDRFMLAGEDLNYSVKLILQDSRAWITKFDNPSKVFGGGNHYEGEEIGEIWGYETLGYFQSDEEALLWADQSAVGYGGSGYKFYAGDIKFADLNNDGKVNGGDNTVANPGDRRIIGNSSYRLPFSIDIDANWKGFDLRIFLQGIGKREAYPSEKWGGVPFWGMYANDVVGVTALNVNDHWTPENPNAYLPRIKGEIAYSGELTYPQTKYLQDASFMRIKNVTIGYTLPKTLTQKWNLNRLRLYLSGENLYTFHHIEVPGNDPEKFDHAIYPFQRTISMGINLSF